MLRLNVVTPERPFLVDECINVLMPGTLGEMQILEGHTSLLSELNSGIVSYEKPNREIVRFMIGEGFVEVDQDHVNILCEQARLKSEVDKDFEEKQLLELKKQMKKEDQAEAEQKRIFAELSRCVAKLNLFE